MESAEVFDTVASSHELEAFIDRHKGKTGQIVIAACKHSCVDHLSEKVKHWFYVMGSRVIYNLKTRQGFAFIGVMGRDDAIERKAVEIDDQVEVSEMFLIFKTP